MSLIQKEIADFTVQCYQNNAFPSCLPRRTSWASGACSFFYPADFTFVCPTELEDLANLYEKFQAIGCEIYSVSCDTHFVHKAWHDASERIQNIQYPMLADPTHCLAKDFEVYIEADGVAERGSFIVNPEGKSWPMRSTPATWAGTPMNFCGRSRPASSWRSTGTRCARRRAARRRDLKPSLDLVGQV